MAEDRNLELSELSESDSAKPSGEAPSDGGDFSQGTADLEAVYDIPVQVSAVLGPVYKILDA